MSLPNFEFDRPDLHTGNPNDDDAVIMDDLVESKADPPKPEELPKTRDIEPLEKPARITRLVTRNIRIDKNWAQPTMILPADPNRKSLRIIVTSTTSTDVVQVSDEMNVAQSSDALKVPVYQGGVGLDGHTGAVWLYAPNVVATVDVSLVAVTL